MTDMRYAISVDAQQADAELARLHKEATTLAGAEDKLAASTKKATAAVVEQGKATAETASKTATFRERVNKLPDVLGKQAAAISLVSSSMEGQNGQVGKLVAGAGQMAAAYGAGGPFALALVGGMALVSAFSSHLEKLNREQDEAIDRYYGPIEAAIEQRKKVERDLAALRRSAAGPETVKEAAARVQAEIDAVEAQIKTLVASRNALKIGTAGYSEAREQHQEQIKQLRATIELLEQKQNLEQGKAAAGGLPRGGAVGAVKAKVDAEIGIEERAQDWLDKMREEAVAHRLKNERESSAEIVRIKQAEADATAKAFADLDKAREAANEKRLRDEQAALMRSVALQQEYASLATGIVASAGTQLVADLVGQQEHALERFGINIMAMAGQALVSYGTQAIGRGILEASSPVTAPLAAASFTAGGILLGSGIALGGAAGGLGSLLGGGSGASAPSERGVSSGFSGGATGGGGGTNITIVYGGASGPTADHAARAVSDSVTRAGARGLNRDEVR